MFKHVISLSWIFLLLGGVNIVSAQPAQIDLKVDSALPDARPLAPVRCGVPFAKGSLNAQDVARYSVVDEQGKAVDYQTKITATWDAQGQQVRWLLVDFLASADHQYQLKLQDAAVEAVPAIATLHDGVITLDTAVLKGSISTTRLAPFDQLTVQNQPVVAPFGNADALMAFNGFYIEHETRGLFRADLDTKVNITLEQTGPVHAIIKAEGDYTNTQGETFGRFSIRMHFFKGRADVRIDHTFIYTGLSSKDRLRSVSMQLQRNPKGRGYVGGEGLEPPMLAHDFNQGWYRQDSVDHEHIELVSDFGKGEVRLAGRSEGWMTFDRLSAVIEGGWRQYPWEFEVEQGQMRVHLWPRHGRLLDTSFDGYFWFLSDEQKKFMLANKSKSNPDLDAWEKQYRTAVNATGAAKTHTLWLNFGGFEGGPYPDAWVKYHGQLAREVASPVIAFADPAYATQTRALDWLTHAAQNRSQFPDEENYIQAMLTLIDKATEAGHHYGWWDFGGYYQRPGQTLYGTQYTREQSHGLDAWHRNRPKAHYGWGELPWQAYFRSGDRKWLRYAMDFTRYSADMAHVHYTAHGRVAGAEYHYDNSEIPWLGGWRGHPGGDAPASNLQLKADYVYEYWLTGEEHPLDVLKLWGQQIKSHDGTWNKWKVGFSRGNDIRNAGAQMHRLLMLYQATWDEDFLKMTEPIIAAFEPLVTADKVHVALDNGNFPDAAGWAYDGLWLHWKITGDKRTHDVLLAFSEYARQNDAGYNVAFGGMRGLMYGYLLTQDTTWLQMLRSGVDMHIIKGVTPLSWSPNTPKFTTIALPRILGTFDSAPDAWRNDNLPLDQKGLSLAYRYASFKGSVAFPASRLFFNEKTDRDWQFTLTSNNGGKFALYAPDGSIVLERSFQGFTQFQIPSDGQSGTYALVCVDATPLIDTGRAVNRDPQARLLRSDLPAVAELPAVNASLAVLARSLFFDVTAAGKQMPTLRIEPADPQRGVAIVGPQKQVIASTDTLPMFADRSWHVPMEGVAPGIYQMKLLTPADTFFNNLLGWPGDDTAAPRKILLDGIPPYVSIAADQWFLPKLPAGLPAAP